MILKGLMLRHSLLFLLKRILLVYVYLNVQGVGISTLPKGSCIGPSFQLQLMRAAPERFAAAVLLQPIGKRYLTFLFAQGLMDFLFVLAGIMLPNTKQFFFPLLVASLTNQYFHVMWFKGLVSTARCPISVQSLADLSFMAWNWQIIRPSKWPTKTGWWNFRKKYFHPENWGRWTHHMFQRGWFNHQLDN